MYTHSSGCRLGGRSVNDRVWKIVHYGRLTSELNNVPLKLLWKIYCHDYIGWQTDRWFSRKWYWFYERTNLWNKYNYSKWKTELENLKSLLSVPDHVSILVETLCQMCNQDLKFHMISLHISLCMIVGQVRPAGRWLIVVFGEGSEGKGVSFPDLELIFANVGRSWCKNASTFDAIDYDVSSGILTFEVMILCFHLCGWNIHPNPFLGD